MTAQIPAPRKVASGASEVIHHEGYDEAIVSPFVPAIRSVSGARLVFISGVTGAPVYHDHPHIPEVFDAVPRDIDGQVTNLFDHLDQALACRRRRTLRRRQHDSLLHQHRGRSGCCEPRAGRVVRRTHSHERHGRDHASRHGSAAAPGDPGDRGGSRKLIHPAEGHMVAPLTTIDCKTYLKGRKHD